MTRRWPLSVGGRLVIDGETITVHSVSGAEVRGYTERGEPARFILTRVEHELVEACNDERRFGSVLVDAGALSDMQLREAAELLGNLNEAWFGYRSGDPERALPGEPRSGFDPVQTTVRQRVGTKAVELGCSAGKLHYKRGELLRRGLAGLLDGRAVRSVTGVGIEERLRGAIIAEARELENASDVRKMQFRARVASRLARESGEPLELPSTRQTFNRIVDEVLRSTGLFRLPAKSRRSAQAAPSEMFGSLVAERPGEFVAIDTTSLDVFAIDPFTFQWVGLDLTAAIDVCTRSILAFRLTPFSTQGVDLALEAIIGRWIAVDYQRRPHKGLRVPEAPQLTLSPNEAYEEAVGRAGFLFVPRDPDLYLRLLPVQARMIARAGVEIGGLSYDSPVLDRYRQRRCPLAALDGKWPIRVDPRELGRVWFQDPRDERFHELHWRHARAVARPFGASALTYVKRLLVEAGMNRPSEEEIATGLARLLHELSDEDLFRDRRARREAVRQAVSAEQRRVPTRQPEKPSGAAQPALRDAWAGIEIPTLELER